MYIPYIQYGESTSGNVHTIHTYNMENQLLLYTKHTIWGITFFCQ